MANWVIEGEIFEPQIPSHLKSSSNDLYHVGDGRGMSEPPLISPRGVIGESETPATRF